MYYSDTHDRNPTHWKRNVTVCVFVCVCVVGTGDPGAGEPGGDVHHPGRGRLTAMHPGSVPPHIYIYTYIHYYYIVLLTCGLAAALMCVTAVSPTFNCESGAIYLNNNKMYINVFFKTYFLIPTSKLFSIYLSVSVQFTQKIA